MPWPSKDRSPPRLELATFPPELDDEEPGRGGSMKGGVNKNVDSDEGNLMGSDGWAGEVARGVAAEEAGEQGVEGVEGVEGGEGVETEGSGGATATSLFTTICFTNVAASISDEALALAAEEAASDSYASAATDSTTTTGKSMSVARGKGVSTSRSVSSSTALGGGSASPSKPTRSRTPPPRSTSSLSGKRSHSAAASVSPVRTSSTSDPLGAGADGGQAASGRGDHSHHRDARLNLPADRTLNMHTREWDGELKELLTRGNLKEKGSGMLGSKTRPSERLIEVMADLSKPSTSGARGQRVGGAVVSAVNPDDSIAIMLDGVVVRGTPEFIKFTKIL